MVRAGAQVIVTQMVSTNDAVRGVLSFPNLIKLNDIMNDFQYELEVYGMVYICAYHRGLWRVYMYFTEVCVRCVYHRIPLSVS